MCYNLTKVESGIFEDCSSLKNLARCFDGCEKLESIPEDLFSYSPYLENVETCFEGCGKLRVPVNIFDNNRRLLYLSGVFAYCWSLSGESPYTLIDGVKWHLYERKDNPDHFVAPLTWNRAFDSCNGLSDYASIPETWLRW